MSESHTRLKPGTRCVIVAGCPQNIGLVVQVIRRIGARYGYDNGYEIQTVSGRTFPQLWRGDALAAGYAPNAFTERYKLRPLVGLDSAEDTASQRVEPFNTAATVHRPVPSTQTVHHE